MWEDIVMPLQNCGAQNTQCLSFPVFFSVPPVEAWQTKLPLRWTAGEAHFELESGASISQHKLHASFNNQKMTYDYNTDLGVTGFILNNSVIDTWYICRGKIDFSSFATQMARLDTDGLLSDPINLFD